MDVSSFYPAIMCEYGIRPEHLTEDFIKILDKIRKERLIAKKEKQTTRNLILRWKNLINSTLQN